jgi:DHA1 family bicyclomycin/chloramphenicol resistance-like MFS transporter
MAHLPMYRIALILGLLSAIGPFAIDMYLPGLPIISQDFGVSTAATQGTISVFFATFGLSQLFYGPWSDQVGRKRPLYFGLALFALASFAAAFAPTVGWLVAARAVQGIGGAAIMVIPRAIVRDSYRGVDGTRLMAAIMLVVSISPMLAPMFGSIIIAVSDWRYIFGALAITALTGLCLVAFVLPETSRIEDRRPVQISVLWSGVKTLMADPIFMGLSFIGGFGMAAFFVFIASASFVYTEHYGMSPTLFSLAFALNAVGFFAASQMAAPLMQRKGASWVITLGTTGFALTMVGLYILTSTGLDTLFVVIPMLMIGYGFLGLVLPTTMMLALEEHGEIAGLASSLSGTFQTVTGGLVVAVMGPFFDNTVQPMVAGIALCSLVSLVLARMIKQRVAVLTLP